MIIKNKVNLTKRVRMDRVVYSVGMAVHSAETSAIKPLAEAMHAVHEQIQSLMDSCSCPGTIEVAPVRISRHFDLVEVKERFGNTTKTERRMNGYDLFSCIFIDAPVSSKLKPSDVYRTALNDKPIAAANLKGMDGEKPSVQVNYRFSISDELLEKSKGELRAQLMCEAERQACEVIQSKEIKPVAVLYGVDFNSKYETSNMAFKRSASLSSDSADEETLGSNVSQSLDYSAMDFMILEQGAPMYTIQDSVSVEWEAKE